MLFNITISCFKNALLSGLVFLIATLPIGHPIDNALANGYLVAEHNTFNDSNASKGPITPDGAVQSRIKLILLDQESLEWGKVSNGLRWPWPRAIYGLIADFCKRANAKVLTFDVLFTEPSFYGHQDDEEFANAIAVGIPVVLAATLPSISDSTYSPGLADESIIVDTVKWLKSLGRQENTFPGLPISELILPSTALGYTNLEMKSNLVSERVTLLTEFKNKLWPVLGLAALIAGERDPTRIEIGGSNLKIGGKNVPIESDGTFPVRFRGQTLPYASFSAAAIVQSELRIRSGLPPAIHPKSLNDCYVFFAFSAPGLSDIHVTSSGRRLPGVLWHATVLDNLLSMIQKEKTN